jgi:hypothetical protein
VTAVKGLRVALVVNLAPQGHKPSILKKGGGNILTRHPFQLLVIAPADFISEVVDNSINVARQIAERYNIILINGR